MKFSILLVSHEFEGKVSGSWVQNHVGTLESAREVADKYQNNPYAQKYGTKYAVVDEVPSPVPMMNLWYDRTLLA